MKPLLLFALFSLPLAAGAAPPPKAAPAALLPPSFAGWKPAGPAHIAATPEAADPAHAAVLQEDGLTQFASATYVQAGQRVSVRAFRFGDATGAFAAYSFYREAGMHGVRVGPAQTENGAEAGAHTLFWSDVTLVDAVFSGNDPAAVADLSALAMSLPHPGGSSRIPPPLPGYLPTDALEPGSVRYSIGPAAYAASANPVPAEVIDFSRDAEVVSGTYHERGETGQLALVMYPTPQMAINRERAIAELQAKLGAGYTERRLGAMLAYTTGSLPKAEAKRLLSGIRYKTEVIVDHPEGYVSEVAKAAKLLLGIGYLTAILGVAAVILAIFLGAGRVLVRRLRGKPISSMNDDDFISLKIDG
jgi:hypothetical protein